MNTAQNVVTMTGGRMTEAEYDRERSKLAPTKKEAQQQAGVRWEQQLAMLFNRSGWTNEQLAAREKKSPSWVSLQLRFGRFLGQLTTVNNVETLPNNFTESRFRNYWRLTGEQSRGGDGGNERIRFRQVLELMRADTTLSRPHVSLNHGPAIKKQFGDGKWHAGDTIVEAIDAPRAEVERSLEVMWQKGTYNTKTERKRVGSAVHYRIFPKEIAVSVKELKEKLTPIIKELMAQGRTNAATVSISTVLHNAARLQKLLDEWLEKDNDE